MTKSIVKNVKGRLEKLVDEIDIYLEKLEHSNNDNTVVYETLLYIAGGLRELLEVEF